MKRMNELRFVVSRRLNTGEFIEVHAIEGAIVGASIVLVSRGSTSENRVYYNCMTCKALVVPCLSTFMKLEAIDQGRVYSTW